MCYLFDMLLLSQQDSFFSYASLRKDLFLSNSQMQEDVKHFTSFVFPNLVPQEKDLSSVARMSYKSSCGIFFLFASRISKHTDQFDRNRMKSISVILASHIWVFAGGVKLWS